MMGVTEVMKRRGNILNSEEFTGKSSALQNWRTRFLIMNLLYSREEISWNWLNRRRCDIFMDVEYNPALVGQCCL
jgi:hypothetical protein